MAPAHAGGRMGGCETHSADPRAPTRRAPRTPATAAHNRQALPRPRSSAAACARQARSSSPAPWRALRLRALQLDPAAARRRIRAAARKASRKSHLRARRLQRGRRASPPHPLDKRFPHGGHSGPPCPTKDSQQVPSQGVSRAPDQGVPQVSLIVTPKRILSLGRRPSGPALPAGGRPRSPRSRVQRKAGASASYATWARGVIRPAGRRSLPAATDDAGTAVP
jgi:hypothetical protein